MLEHEVQSMSWWTSLYWLNAHRVGCSFEHPFKAIKYTQKLIRCGVQLEKENWPSLWTVAERERERQAEQGWGRGEKRGF